jgi:hypothetical protein
MQYQYGDLPGALRAIEKIKEPDSRDLALYYLLAVATNSNPASTPATTPSNAAPTPSAPALSGKAASERKRQVAEQIADEKQILDAMSDHGMRAMAWCRAHDGLANQCACAR